MKKLFILAISAGLMFAAGCQLFGDDPASPASAPVSDEPVEQVVDLDSPTGGYTATDEEPAFGEPDKFTFGRNECEYQDRYQNTWEYRKRNQFEGAKRYRLRAIWGHLERSYQDSTDTECCPVDFSGYLKFNAGVVVVERTIGFEMLDYITRKDGSTIEWVSHTCPGVDGIQFKLVSAPAIEDSVISVDNDEVVLRIEAGPYSGSFTMDQLDSLAIMEEVDDCGNGVMINSFRITNCPHGYMLGRWFHVEPDTIISPDSTETRGIIEGRFRGMWISDVGRPAGYLRGVFGKNSSGENVFFGKYVDFRGQFKGIMKGRYGSYPTQSIIDRLGWYKGIWLGRNAVREGYLQGDWIADGQGHGFFHGKWGKECLIDF